MSTMKEYLIRYIRMTNQNQFAEHDTICATTAKRAIEKIKEQYPTENIQIDIVRVNNGFGWQIVNPLLWEEA